MATIKNEDITKTGPMSYRQLQDANTEQLEGVRPEFQSMLDNLYRAYPTVSAHDASVQSEGPVSSGLSDTDTPWGASRFDENTANEEQFRRLGDTRAENEPWFAKLGAGVAKGAVLAGTTFLNGTLGLAAGIGTAIGEGRWSGIWDNDFSNAMNEFNEWSEKVMPNYYTEAEQNRPWYKNLGTANFWGDKFIKNLGFTIGAYYSGGVYSKGMGALMEALHAGTKATSMVTSGLGAVISAVNEGSIEGLNGMKEYEQQYRPVLEAQYQERVQAIQAEYDMNRGKRLVSTGSENTDYVDPAYVKYINDMKTARANYESALGRLEQDKAKVGNMILAMNIPILTASNLFQFGKLYSRGYNTSRRTLGIVGNPGKYAAEGTSKLITAGQILKGGWHEGSEEVKQQIATDVSKHYYAEDVNNYYRSLHDPKASEDTLNWFKTFGETMVQTLGEGSTWEQFFIGGLTGILGMPRFRGIRNEQGKLQSPVVLEENAISKWKDLRKQAEANKAIADKLNERVNSPEFKNYYQGLVRHNKYQDDMNDAAWRGDEFDYKNAEHAQLVSDIALFYNAGKLDDLKTLIGSAYDLSDENLESIVKNTTSTVEKDGKNVKVGPFIDEKGNPVDKETMKEKLTQQRDEILNTIDNYVKTRNYIDNYTMGRLTDDQLDELVLLRTQRDNWLERSTEMSGQVRSSLKNVIGKLNQYIHALEGVMYEEGKNNKGLTEGYNKADEMKRGLAKAVETLNTVIESDDAGMVGILSANPKFVDAVKKTLDAIDDTVLDQDSKTEVKTKLDDILRIGKATDLYNNKIKEYYLHPDKQAEDHAGVDEETAGQYASAEEAETVNKLNTAATFKDVTDVMNERKVTPANLDNSTSTPAREYMKATMFKKKAEELINSSNSPRKAELLDMLNRRFDESDNYDDLSDPSLLTELPKTAVAMDSVQQDTLEHEFSEVIKAAADKIASGKSQKQSVNPEKTGTSTPPNAGKDDVEQPPVSTEGRADAWLRKIDMSKIPAELHEEVKELVKNIEDNVSKLEKGYDQRLARSTRSMVNALSVRTGNTAIANIIKKVRDVTTTPVQDTSSQDDVLRENAAENASHASTPVTGVLKAVVPQFDLDAKRDGRLIDFVGDGRNSGYAYVYRKLSEPQGMSNPNLEKVLKAKKSSSNNTINTPAVPAKLSEKAKELTEKLSDKLKKLREAEDGSDEQEEAMIEIEQGLPEEFSYSDDRIYVYVPSLLSNVDLHSSNFIWKVGDTIQIDQDDFAPIAIVTEVNSDGNIVEAMDEQGVILVKDGRILSKNEVVQIRDSNKGKSAFDYVNEGNVKDGDELEVRYEEATDEHPELLGLYHNGVLVNYMNTDESIPGVKEIKDKAKTASHNTIHVSNNSYIWDKLVKIGLLEEGKRPNGLIGSRDDDVPMNEGQRKAVRAQVKRVLEKENAGTKQELHDAISNKATNATAQAGVFEFLYEAQDKVRSGELTVDDFISLIDNLFYYNARELTAPQNPKVRVSKIMDGEFGYDRTKTQSIGDLLGADNAVIGVMKNRAMAANTDMYVEPVFDEANSDGRVYLLLPNSKGTLTPQRVYIRHFNSSEADINDARNPIIAELRELFRQLTTLSDDGVDMEGRLDSLYGTLVGLLYVPDSFHINIVQNRNSVFLRVSFNDRDGNRVNRDVLLRKFAQKSLLTIGEGESQSEEGFTPDRTTLFNQIIGVFQEANLAFNIDANRLAGKNGNEYADKLKRSNVLATYLTGKRMQGTWFLLNEKPGNPHTNDGYRRAKALQDAKDGVRVTNNGKEYFVRNGIVYDKTGSQMYLKPDEERLIKDLAYIESAYGNSYYGVNQDNGRVLISDSDGVRGFDRNTRKYLNDTELENLRASLEGRKNKAELTGMAVKSLEDSQKLVLRLDDGRPDTSSGSYMIKEDDGQYHEYQRVHSVIGSNYIGPSTRDNATRRGSVVDEVSRQYLIDPEHTAKPDEMSEVAFNSLKKGLDQFKADTEKKGLKIITDRTVVFHKYDDGRRIAGELDVFAYNPYTGAVTIFDFKTSKYSTSDTSFSKVTNPNMFVRSNKDQYSRQLSAYSRLFTDSFGVPVSNLVIVPFQIRYGKENGSISAVFPEKYVPLDYDSDVFSDSNAKPESHPTPSQSQMDQFNAIDALLGSPSPEPKPAKADNPVPPAPVSPEAKPVISDDIYSRKWDDMTEADKAYIRPVFPGMSDADIQKFWDGLDENFRKEYVVSCL